MYLTGGQYKGSKVKVPDGVRPTLSKVRQALFNILSQFNFKNYTFLDMFAGSGLIGLEAVSRGYNVLELEINYKNAKIIKENYKNIATIPNIITTNSLNYKTNNKYEIIYIDPPWVTNYMPIIQKASTLLDENGLIIIEFDDKSYININLIEEKFSLIKQKKYGRTIIVFLQKKC